MPASTTYSSPSDFCIQKGAIRFELNALGDPDKISVSLAAGAVIMAYKRGVIDYNAGLNYRTWLLIASPTHFDRTEKVYVYVKLSRLGDTAMLVYPYEKMPIEPTEDGDYYIMLGALTPSVSGDEIVNRDWGTGEEALTTGTLDTDQYWEEQSSDELRKMFQLVNNVIWTQKDLSFITGARLLLLRMRVLGQSSTNAEITHIATSDSISDSGEFTPNDTSLITTSALERYANILLSHKFFRKDQDDTDPFTATFGDVHVTSGLERGEELSGGNLSVDGDASIGGNASIAGDTDIDGILRVLAQKIVTNLMESDNFSGDWQDAFGSGFQLKKGTNGITSLVVDNLFVRMKAIFSELEIRKISYAGGNIIFSHAGSVLEKVVPVYEGGYIYQEYIVVMDDDAYYADRGIWNVDGEFDGKGGIIVNNARLEPNPEPRPSDDKIIAYRCYIKADDGTTQTTNWWKADDQARWQTFNIKKGVYQNVENTYGWRLVTKTGEELMDDGLIHQYIDISKADCADLSDAPKAGDQLVQMGNRTNPDRQGFISIEVEGEYAPAFKMYKGVNSYSLEGKRKVCISPFLVDMHYQKLVMETDYDIAQVPMQRSEPWHQGMQCYYYDLVQHNGASWLCIYPESGIGGVLYTTEEPSENAVYWRPYAQKGEQGDPGTSITKISEVTEYVLSTDGETPKSGETWSTTKPTPAQGEYVLTRITITWSDESETVMQNAERNPNDGVSGQDIIVDGATVMKYCCNQSNTTHPDEDSSDWKNLDQVTQTQGWWLWSKATTWYRKAGSSAGAHDAGKSVVYNVSYIAEDGDTPEAARGITSITEYYKATNSSTPLPAPTSDAGWDTDPNLSGLTDKWDADHIYLWNYEKVTYSKAPLVERTIPQILAIWTQDGEPGRGVDSITNKYKVTNTNVAPAREHEGGTGWSTSPVAPGKGEYLWNYEIIAWTSGTTPTYTDVQQIGYAGTDGASITKSSEVKAYQVSDNGTTTPTGTWQDEAHKPTPSQGQYLWTRTTITWSDGSTTVLYSAERNPNDGQPGMSVTITGQSVTYSKQTSGNLDPTTLTYGSYPSSLSKGDWLYSKTTVTYSDNTSTNSYGVTYIGTDGDTGRGIQSVVEEYAVNNDPNTAPASSSFSTTFPSNWGENNKYVWNREVITYTKGSPASETTTPRIKAIWTKDGKGIDSIVNRYLTNNVSTGITKQNYKSYNDGNEWPTTITPTSASNPYLWNFEVITYTDGTSEMTDPHVIGHFGKNGDQGADAVNVIVSPASLIVNQSLDDPSNLSNLSEQITFSVTKGTVQKTVTKVEITSIEKSGSYNKLTVSGSNSGNIATLTAIGTYTENGKTYYWDNAYFIAKVYYSDGTTKSIENVKVKVYANLLGTWKEYVEEDTKTEIAERTQFDICDETGAVVSHTTLANFTRSSSQNTSKLTDTVTDGTGTYIKSSEIKQSVDKISLKVDEGLKSNLIEDPIFVKGDQFTTTGKSGSAPFTVSRTYTAKYPFSPWLEDNGGTYGIGISGTAGSSAYNAWLTPYSTPRIQLSANKKYTFSVWVKHNKSTGELSDYFVDRIAAIVMYNAATGGNATSEIDLPLTNKVGEVDGWEQYAVTFTCPNSYTYFSWYPKVGVKAGTVGITIRYVGVKLEIGEVATPMTYSLKPYLLATGIDIENKKITMTADQFVCQNNSGVKTAWLDEFGNWITTGVQNNLITVINASNATQYILEDGNGDLFLDVLRCGDFILIESLPSSMIGGSGASDYKYIRLPYFINRGSSQRGQTKFLTGTQHSMKSDEMRQLVGRRITIRMAQVATYTFLDGIANYKYYGTAANALRRLCNGQNVFDFNEVTWQDYSMVPRVFHIECKHAVLVDGNNNETTHNAYIWTGQSDYFAETDDGLNWT